MKRLPVVFASILLIICMIAGNAFAEGENNSPKATVTFDFQDIGTTDKTVMEVEPGSTIETKPAVPEVSGMMLEGWYSDPEFTNKWVFDTTPVNGNIILYAHWIETNEDPAPEGVPEESDDPDEDEDPDEEPAPEDTPEALSDTKGGLTPVPEESSDPDEDPEDPAPEGTPDAFSSPKGGLTPDGTAPEDVTEESSDPDENPDENPAPEGTPDALSSPKGGLTPNGTAPESMPKALSSPKGGLTPFSTVKSYPVFNQSETVNGMVITVSAQEGVFPEGARLLVDLVSNAATESAVEGLREEDANVSASYSFDIRVVDEDGHEIQPVDEQQICVVFQMEEIGDENLDTTVYHIPDNGPAEVLDVTEDASSETAAVTTDGFSLYRVEFIYKTDKTERTYYVDADYSQFPLDLKLSVILKTLGIEEKFIKVSDQNHKKIDLSWIKDSSGNDCKIQIIEPFEGEGTLTVEFNNGSSIDIKLVVNLIFTDGDWDFYPTDGYRDAVITQYIGNEKSITLPETVHHDNVDFTVTEIGDEAFNGTDLTSVVIPDTVMKIGFGSFNECSKLTNVVLPASLQTVGPYAFYGCSSLTKLMIPGGVQHFDEGTFFNCDNLTDVYFKGDKHAWDNLYGRPEGPNVHVRYESGTVTVAADPAGGGTVTGGGWYGKDENGVGESVTVEATPAAGYVFVNWTKPDGDPSKPESTDAKYTFAYDGNTALTAHFSPAVTVKWVNDDGKELYSSPVAINTLPTYGGPTPTKAEDNDYTYTFKEWSPEVVPATVDTTYKAVYTATKKIKYVDTEGAGQEYKQGSDGTLTFVFKRSENDEETFRHFTGLKADGKLLTRDKDYTAKSGSVIIELQSSFLKTLSVGDHTLTATFDDGPDANVSFTVDPPPTYTVTFNANGHGTAPAAQTVTEGQTAVKPAAPTADGYTFGGWFTDQACTCPFDFSTPITKDLVLYAKWTSGRNVPRTGDPNNTGLWVSLTGLSILLISGAIIAYRKRRTR